MRTPKSSVPRRSIAAPNVCGAVVAPVAAAGSPGAAVVEVPGFAGAVVGDAGCCGAAGFDWLCVVTSCATSEAALQPHTKASTSERDVMRIDGAQRPEAARQRYYL